ncbi:maleate cis-trans isomerase family protein [Neoroseomonas lacus]|uniref:Asp/Glu racemase n=1 Tax=Neoroseomonas lacus TaxID=287609 RepID=A0A917KIM6_9PROT|nr:aspartate/glutamate racemase family protein [Neoroseomonas lacus]GGJ12841.1 Asp/Glu racemase [Neoroseomonas lacus]
MTTCPAIGSITPSSNRVVERTLAGILRHLPGIDSCIARIPYYGDGLGQPKDGYDAEAYRHAAWTLGHAEVGAVCWNGTRGAGFGLDADRALVRLMAEAAGCPATTASLATVQLLDAMGARRIGIVTPGDAAYAAQAARGLGRDLAGLRALGLTNNHDASLVPTARIIALAREVAAEATPDAILLWSTNLFGLDAMATLEAELGIPVIDSAAAGVWGCLRAIGADMAPATPLGRIFALAA